MTNANIKIKSKQGYGIKSGTASDVLFMGIYILLILLGTKVNVFSYGALFVGMILIAVKPIEYNISVLFLIMPFATIFKSEPGGQSFFTYVLLFFVLRNCFKRKVSKLELSIAFFGIFLLAVQIFAGNGIDVTRTLKMVMEIEFLYIAYTQRSKLHLPKVCGAYIAGTLMASFLAKYGTALFDFAEYVEEKTFKYEVVRVGRFSGLYGDPNYYGVNLVIAGCLLILLLYSHKIKAPAFLLGMACILFFSILTYSKSVILMLLFLILFFIISRIKQRKYMGTVVFTVLGTVFVVMAFSGYFSFMDGVIYRLKGDSLGALTTGRTDIWVDYLNTIGEELRYLPFGRGISADWLNDKAAHSVYIQEVYYLGIVGTAWLSALLVLIAGSGRLKRIGTGMRKKNILNYSVLICVVIMYFFLSELFYYDAIFHLTLAYLVMSCDIEHLEEPELSYGSKSENISG